MATVVITFFLFARFYVCKMDADYQERPRDRNTSRREKRWSMNSQRLEEIVAELMKPISDIRRSFDTDLSALLEEYLTEAGLHALEASEASEQRGAPSAPSAPAAPAAPAPNYPELALLLQHSASLYGRKVDFLYQHVLSVSDSLQNGTQEEVGREAGDGGDGGDGGEESPRRRRRRLSLSGRFCRLELEPEASAGARRECGPPPPPPTLPRMYIELEPRVLTDGDAPLTDYHGDPVGLVHDFHVTWRLQEGFLVDELEGPRSCSESQLNPLSLVELQAAISAAAPPSPPPLRARLRTPDLCDEPPPAPLHASTPLPHLPHLPDVIHALDRKRKRRSDVKLDYIVDANIKILISKELRRKLRSVQEFSISSSWISRVVERRKRSILAERRRLRAHHPHHPRPPNIGVDRPEFHGFDHSDIDIGGFVGWSGTEAALATARVAREPDSDDDGFFEQSSLGDSDHSRVEELSVSHVTSHVTSHASSSTLEVHEVARGVLAACPASGEAAPFASLVRSAARHPADVSRLLLATLFLANAGNVEIVHDAAAPPLAVGAFSLRLLSTDERLYCAAVREHFHR